MLHRSERLWNRIAEPIVALRIRYTNRPVHCEGASDSQGHPIAIDLGGWATCAQPVEKEEMLDAAAPNAICWKPAG